MDMTPERWQNTTNYLQQVFGQQDQQLETLMARAVNAGLPEIAVSSEVGRFLKLLAGLTNQGRGPQIAIEVGTLAGYSGIWLARALAHEPSPGKLITIELDEKHAAFAQAEFDAAGIADRVRLVRGAALDVLPTLARELGPETVDFVFLDAVKTEYHQYVRILKPVLKRGALMIADNALGADYWIDDPPGTNESRDAIDAFNRAMAADQDFETAAVPVRQGLLIARRL